MAMDNQSAVDSDKRVGIWILRLLILASISGLLLGFGALIYAHNGNDWPKVRGTITYSKMVGPTGHASANIRYEYTVDGHSYKGEHVSFANLFHIQMHDVKSIVSRYPAKAQVWVYFHPKNPKRAVLEKDAPSELYWTVIAALILLILGLFFHHRLKLQLQ